MRPSARAARSRKRDDWFHKLEFKLADTQDPAKWVKTQRVMGRNPTMTAANMSGPEDRRSAHGRPSANQLVLDRVVGHLGVGLHVHFFQ